MSSIQAVDRSPARRRTLSTATLRGILLWSMGFAGAFVFIEPSPYEFVALVGIGLFALTGLTVRPALMPLVLILVLIISATRSRS